MAWKTQQVMGLGGRNMEVAGTDCYLTERRPNVKFGKLNCFTIYVCQIKKYATLCKNLNGDKTNTERNKEVYSELIEFLDDKSLSFIMREASDNGRGALKILRDYYVDKGKAELFFLLLN